MSAALSNAPAYLPKDGGNSMTMVAARASSSGLARELAEVSGIALPQDLKLPGQRAAQIQYGVMSPAMKAAQDAELTEQRAP